MDKFNLNEYVEKKFGPIPESVALGMYLMEIEEMLDLVHLFYTNREKYDKEVQ